MKSSSNRETALTSLADAQILFCMFSLFQKKHLCFAIKIGNVIGNKIKRSQWNGIIFNQSKEALLGNIFNAKTT